LIRCTYKKDKLKKINILKFISIGPSRYETLLMQKMGLGYLKYICLPLMKRQIFNLEWTTPFWNNLHQVLSRLKDVKPNNLNVCASKKNKITPNCM
jgi:hypothetical protein